MKLFLKVHLPWLLLEIVSLGLLILLIWLDGYRDLGILIYGVSLILCLTIVFLTIDYHKNQGFYGYLETGHMQKKSAGFISRTLQRHLHVEQQHMQQQLTAVDQHYQTHIKFMHIWVHQMKTPVAVLALMAESDQLDSDDLLAETDRLKSGLATALNFVRLEDFKEDFLIETLSLAAIIKESIGEQKRSFIRHRVYPKIIDQTDFLVTTDKKWLQIMLYQLISNGIKYSDPEGQLVFALDAEHKRLTISDAGCGIPDSDLPRIFRPFFTGDNGRALGEATGMGLYLVDMISEQLAISVAITSTQGIGTRVVLTFEQG
ncbi:sensor histidine kinase [Enterococcus sp. RIT-PI-f]|uniref:sensor histidine kinase n=1 Tax=Enterococcus sp. RIT-PI-f TaxID=1690244 RepID=UPI0006BA09E5|nr:sensor histidine kinase [Enterococcus sp. RIT-PI-f]KPG72967.1 histidine kinase [Enterococcus sp. RIT-PI-f]